LLISIEFCRPQVIGVEDVVTMREFGVDLGWTSML